MATTAVPTTFENITYEKGANAYVTVNRPKVLNALNISPPCRRVRVGV